MLPLCPVAAADGSNPRRLPGPDAGGPVAVRVVAILAHGRRPFKAAPVEAVEYRSRPTGGILPTGGKGEGGLAVIGELDEVTAGKCGRPGNVLARDGVPGADLEMPAGND